jgi:hypothetical protein
MVLRFKCVLPCKFASPPFKEPGDRRGGYRPPGKLWLPGGTEPEWARRIGPEKGVRCTCVASLQNTSEIARLRPYQLRLFVAGVSPSSACVCVSCSGLWRPGPGGLNGVAEIDAGPLSLRVQRLCTFGQ